jgi:aldose 1-epimerase
MERVLGVALLALLCPMFMMLGAPTSPAKEARKPKVFGTTAEGQTAYMYVLENRNGMKATVINYGAILVSLQVPDRSGKLADVVLGYDNLDGYRSGTQFFGAIVGRYGNRIANGKFSLSEKTYQLSINDGVNHLHGGVSGFSKQFWTAKPVSVHGDQGVQLSLVSKDGDQGYPGTLSATVTYVLSSDRNELTINYSGTTDQETVVNLTNHSYFNLSGEGQGNILQQELKLSASYFTPVNKTLIPTGEIRDVHGTPFDFLAPHPIGGRINQKDEQLEFGQGYDHNWVLEKGDAQPLTEAAEAYDPKSGRVLTVLTTQPGVQFYSGNFLNDSVRGKGGKVYGHRAGFCLETQHFPDSPNRSNFPSTVLKPGDEYKSTTVFRFSTR